MERDRPWEMKRLDPSVCNLYFVRRDLRKSPSLGRQTEAIGIQVFAISCFCDAIFATAAFSGKKQNLEQKVKHTEFAETRANALPPNSSATGGETQMAQAGDAEQASTEDIEGQVSPANQTEKAQRRQNAWEKTTNITGKRTPTEKHKESKGHWKTTGGEVSRRERDEKGQKKWKKQRSVHSEDDRESDNESEKSPRVSDP